MCTNIFCNAQNHHDITLLATEKARTSYFQTHSRQSFHIRFVDRILTRIRNVLRCRGERASVYRRRRWQGDEGPRGRRTLTGREASQEDYRKQIISVEIPLANSLATTPERFGTETSRGIAEARTEVVEARHSALQDLFWRQPSDIVDKIIEGSSIIQRKIDLDELCRAASENQHDSFTLGFTKRVRRHIIFSFNYYNNWY